MIIKYFSWIREHVGKSEEEIELPHNIKTIDDLIKYLSSVNDNYKSAFANKEIIKINQFIIIYIIIGRMFKWKLNI